MGTLTYDSAMTIEFDDRVLAHLQLVIGAKLRRRESCFFTWRDDPKIGDGRTTIWAHPTISIVFKFTAPARPRSTRAGSRRS
jgi:hypothetical protein